MIKLKDMVYKRFYIKILVLVLLLALTPVLFTYVYSKKYMVVTTYSLIVVWVFQIVYLLHYINKTNRDLARFFTAFQCRDSTLVFNEKKKDKAFKNLHQSFNQIITAFGKIKIEKEKEFVFFQHTVELVGVGLLAFDHKGKVRLCNKAFKELFLIKNLLNITALECIENSFPCFLTRLTSGEQRLKNYLIKNRIVKLTIKAVDFKLENECIKLVAFQDIKNEIDKGEMEAMHKLIRIFTHEIINSVSPISLLSSSLIELYKLRQNDPLVEGQISNTIMGLETIRKRSKALIAFVDGYKSLTQLPKPRFELFLVVKLFEHIKVLFCEEFKKEGINFEFFISDLEQELIADEKLVAQILINLIRNSIDALRSKRSKLILLSVNKSNPVTCIRLSDNGIGISQEIMEHIFTPFFTTKQKGSGIGLNLSRQIMRLHGGSISVTSEPNRGTEFRLQF